MSRRILLSTTITLAISAANPNVDALKAQTASRGPRPDPVTVVLVDQLPRLNQDYAAVVMRVAEPEPHDLILLPRATASGALLDAATRTLLHSRAVHGVHVRMYKGQPFHTLTLGVRMNNAPAAWAQHEVPLAQRVVDRLQNAPARNIVGVGTVPEIQFYPPRLRR